MFKYAPKSQWWEDGWGDQEAAPEEIQPPIDEIDAYQIDKLITKLDERLKLALLIAYAEAPKVFRFRRFGFDESVAEAERKLQDMVNLKAVVIHQAEVMQRNAVFFTKFLSRQEFVALYPKQLDKPI